MNETKQYLIEQMKRCNISLNYNQRDDYNGQLLRPKVKGTKDQIEVAKMIVTFYQITRQDWKGVKV